MNNASKFLEAPRYAHSCPTCQYLGRFAQWDLYICGHGSPDTYNADLPTVIARYGNDGSEYTSGLNAAWPYVTPDLDPGVVDGALKITFPHRGLYEARVRAQRWGLLSPEWDQKHMSSIWRRAAELGKTAQLAEILVIIGNRGAFGEAQLTEGRGKK